MNSHKKFFVEGILQNFQADKDKGFLPNMLLILFVIMRDCFLNLVDNRFVMVVAVELFNVILVEVERFFR